jgi:predicted phosphoribosyltransferase
MFENREEAGVKLSEKLSKFKDRKDVVVVGLTRGGVITAKSLSEKLNLKFIPLIVKKISLPYNQELAIGAVVDKKNFFWNEDLCKRFRISYAEKQKLILEKVSKIRKLKQNWGIKEIENLSNKTVIIVDDGVATGASVIAAGIFIRNKNPKEIYLAVPVIAFDTLKYVKRYFDKVFFVHSSKNFYAVGEFYKYFPQISDEETARILKI